MDTREARILAALKDQHGAICDDCLAPLAGLLRRQDASSVGTRLGKAEKISRSQGVCAICGKVKIVSRTFASPPHLTNVDRDAELRGESPGAPQALINWVHVPPVNGDPPWYWEGNVQSRLIGWLAQNAHHLQRVANTATREQGIDVEALTPSGQRLLISVKGHPQATEKTKAPTQARHWFSSAVFDLVLYRDAYPDARLALALPAGFRTYDSLAQRIQWLRKMMPFAIYWVAETGDVRVE